MHGGRIENLRACAERRACGGRTCCSVYSSRNCDFSFSTLCLWFLKAILAKCSLVVPAPRQARPRTGHTAATVELHVLATGVAKHLRRHGSRLQSGCGHHHRHVLVHGVGAVLELRRSEASIRPPPRLGRQRAALHLLKANSQHAVGQTWRVSRWAVVR